jgi:hypothetical protein
MRARRDGGSYISVGMVVGLDKFVTVNEFLVLEKIFVLDAGGIFTERILTR